MRAADPDFVYYIETRGPRMQQPFLRASPIDVSRIIRDALVRTHARRPCSRRPRSRWTVRSSTSEGALGIRARRGTPCRLGVRLRHAGAALLAPPHAPAQGAGLRRGGGPRDHRDRQALARTRVRPLYQLRGPAERFSASWKCRCRIRFSSRGRRRGPS